MDFSRAFDLVVHSKLLYKLETVGLSACLLNWIASFLTSRKQCTVIDHCASTVSDVISGVIQGSCIGPVLFLLFINDIADLFNNGDVTCKLYADDLKLFSAVTLQNSVTPNNITDAVNKLAAWADQWQLSINISKCHVLHLGRNNPRLTYFLKFWNIAFLVVMTHFLLQVTINLASKSHLAVLKLFTLFGVL